MRLRPAIRPADNTTKLPAIKIHTLIRGLAARRSEQTGRRAEVMHGKIAAQSW